MSMSTNTSGTHCGASRRLSASLARVLRELDKDFERRIYQELAARGYPDVRPSHGPVFSNLGLGAMRVTQLAQRSQVTQQAMGKMLKELELLGYVVRNVDQGDRRAREIQLTERGQALVECAGAAADAVREYYAQRIGSTALDDLEARLRDAARTLALQHLPPDWADPPPAGD
ncbi:MAG: MarR family transcriptional regulator [Gammaproteobacteria bacterium]|nr:MarR family transcriptional regulator [Gammaproteobacteria bacterium]